MSDWENKHIPKALWATWPWNRCRAVWLRSGEGRRCDLRRGHQPQEHCSEHGLDVLWWREIELIPLADPQESTP